MPPLTGRHAITEGGRWEPRSPLGGRRSIGPEIGGPDHLAPFLGFRRYMLSEVGRRADKYRGAEFGQPRLQLWIGEAGIDLQIELVDDLDRCLAGRADTKPAACRVAGHELSDG